MLCFLHVWALFFYEMQWVVFPPVLSFAVEGSFFLFFFSVVVLLLNFFLVSEPCKDDIEICCRKRLFHSARPPPDHYCLQTWAREARDPCWEFWLAWGCMCLALCLNIMYFLKTNKPGSETFILSQIMSEVYNLRITDPFISNLFHLESGAVSITRAKPFQTWWLV